MCEVDSDGDGKVSYEEFVPVCFEILVQLFAHDLIQRPTDEVELAKYLIESFRECVVFSEKLSDSAGRTSSRVVS